MLPYWILFLFLSIGAMLSAPGNRAFAGSARSVDGITKNQPDPIFGFGIVLIILMIGLRFEVGGDWSTYLDSFQDIGRRTLSNALNSSQQEAGYTTVNWLAARLGGGIWLVNLLCASLFGLGLAAICKQQPNPWLALVVATPLFIVIVGMGYTRQAAAVGLLMIGLARVADGRSYWAFLPWPILGFLFHQSVLVFVPVVAFIYYRKRFELILLGALALIIGYYTLLPTAIEKYSAGYLKQIYVAQGAIFRLALDALAGIVMLALRGKISQKPAENALWTGWALLSIASLVMFLMIESTIIVDRLAIYLIPLQIFAFSRLPQAIGGEGKPNLGWTAAVVVMSAVVLLTWLLYANHSEYWLPYQIYPLV